MSNWFLWMVLSMVTGSPLLSLVLVLGLVWAADRFTVGVLPSPLRALKRWQRAGQLERTLQTNPHDRRARYELADLRVGRGRYAAAVEALKPNLDEGDEDVGTLYLLGVAYLGMGDAARGELLLDEAAAREPGYQMGAIDLERGRFRLARGEVNGAVEALERLCAARPGTVEGRVLLARALARSGREEEAARVREQAWKEYVAAPRFQRRRERLWAWRARPGRPLAYGVVMLLAFVLGFSVMSRVSASAPAGYYDAMPMAADE
ncbi:MAG TPA: tetratricopeptide repeat protein [Myxococcaceae bacterium]|nr:tetratricopeptide repeat protein [Myxococcaceae bacterium]